MIHVVGSVCFDVVAERDSYLPGTSNPATITARLGGVAFNIFSHLTSDRRLITALGDDDFSEIILRMLREESGATHQEAGARAPVDSRHVEISVIEAAGTPSPFYVAIMESGELNVAASQMDVIERALTPERLGSAFASISQDDIVMVDANLSVDTLDMVLERIGQSCRVVYEPISVGKAGRHRHQLRNLFLTTPNEHEFHCLLDSSDGSAPSDDEVFAYLDARRIRFLLRTRGADGATLYGDHRRLDFPPAKRVKTGDTTGAGDMITALIVDGVHMQGPEDRVGFSELAGAIPTAMAAVERFLESREA